MAMRAVRPFGRVSDRLARLERRTFASPARISAPAGGSSPATPLPGLTGPLPGVFAGLRRPSPPLPTRVRRSGIVLVLVEGGVHHRLLEVDCAGIVDDPAAAGIVERRAVDFRG